MRRRRKRNPGGGRVLAIVGGYVGGLVAARLLSPRMDGGPLLALSALGLGGGFLLSKGSDGRAAAFAGAVGSGMATVVALTLSGPWTVHEPHPGQSPAEALPPPAVIATWQEFPPEGAAVPLAPGFRYRAAIDLPWGVGVLATDARVRDKAAELGFADVAIARERPASWSDWTFARGTAADLFVEATYRGAPKWLERDARIVGAWALA